MKPAMKRLRKTKLLSVIMAASLVFNSAGLTVLAEPAADDTQIIMTVADDTSDGTDVNSDVSEGDVSVNDVTAEDISAGDVSASDVSDGNVPAAPAQPLFTGLGEDYVLSAQQLADKQTLAEYTGEISTFTDNLDYETGNDLYVPGEVIFLTDSEEEAQLVAEGFDGTLESYFDGVAVVMLPANRTVVQAVLASADPAYNLPAVWPNYYRYFSATYNDPALAENNAGYQWFHESVGDKYVWDAGYKGQGVKIGIVDSGALSSQEDIKSQIKQNLNMSGTTAAATTTDPNGHGTHVSGIAAATANNGKGGAGVAPSASLYVYSVADSKGSVDSAATIRALNRAISDKVDVINMSLGGPNFSDAENAALQSVYNAGITVFAAAGNECANTLSYPASYKNVVSVGALKQDGKKTNFSNYNAEVDLAFPGLDIYSTYNSGASSYTFMSGTSMACPVATGTAAVILSGAGTIPELQGKTGAKRVDALVSVMKKNAVKSGSAGMGAGTTYLPKVFGITPATADAVPAAPIFSAANKTEYSSLTASITISGIPAGCAAFYSTDGKTPSFKNGAITNGTRYTGAITIGNAKSVTLKAITVNLTTGKTSKVASATYTFKPNPTALTIASANGCNSVVPVGSLTLKATVTPSYAIPVKTTWSVAPADKGVTVSASGKVSVAKTATAGNYTVTASATTTDKNRTAVTRTAGFTITVKPADAATIKSIALAKGNTSLSLIPGKTASLGTGLTVTNKDGKTGSTSGLVWSSSDTSVATVTAAGMVTAKAIGKAEIRVAANDGSGKSAVCKLTVGEPVTSITLSGPTKMTAGKSISLKATVLPAKAAKKTVEWTSNNEKVAVKNGKVTADKSLAAGTRVTVTATATDGSGMSTSWAIIIYADTIKSVSLDQKSLTLFTTKGYSNAPTSATLKATVTGGDASAVTYSSSAPGIATVNASGVVTAVSCGKTTITCLAANGKKATCAVTVSAPMSRLDIVPATDNEGVISVGTTVKLGTKINTSFGKPANTKIKWSVKSGYEKIISVSSSGVVKALSMGSATGNSTTAIVIAEATDGSNVKAEYEITVLRKIKQYGVTYSSYYGTFTPWVVFDNGNKVSLSAYTVNVSSPKNIVSCSYGGSSFTIMPSKPTTKKASGSISSRTITSSDFVTAKVKVTFQTGGNKSWSGSYKLMRSTDDHLYVIY